MKNLKSIALAFIETKGYELPTNQLPSIPYLDCIQKLIGGDSHF